MFDFSEDEMIEFEIDVHNYVDEYLQKHGLLQCQPEFWRSLCAVVSWSHLCTKRSFENW